MRQRPLTELQRLALIQLHLRWRWGIDHRTSRGLRERGLISVRPHTFADHAFGRIVSVMLPWLTPEGERLAKELWLELPIDRKEAARGELARWGL